MFSLILLFCILGEHAWFDMTEAFFILATWPNKLTMTLIHWQPLELKPLFLVLSILLNLKKEKDHVFPYLREKEGASGLCWDWLRNKVWGWVFPPQSCKNGKRKIIVDDKVLKWKMIAVWKKEQQRIKEKKKTKKKKGLFLKLCSITLSSLLFQKHTNPKVFPTFALASL